MEWHAMSLRGNEAPNNAGTLCNNKGNNNLMKRNMDRFLFINYSNYGSTFRSGG